MDNKLDPSTVNEEQEGIPFPPDPIGNPDLEEPTS